MREVYESQVPGKFLVVERTEFGTCKYGWTYEKSAVREVKLVNTAANRNMDNYLRENKMVKREISPIGLIKIKEAVAQRSDVN